jgi:hypothetical protein
VCGWVGRWVSLYRVSEEYFMVKNNLGIPGLKVHDLFKEWHQNGRYRSFQEFQMLLLKWFYSLFWTKIYIRTHILRIKHAARPWCLSYRQYLLQMIMICAGIMQLYNINNNISPHPEFVHCCSLMDYNSIMRKNLHFDAFDIDGLNLQTRLLYSCKNSNQFGRCV